MSNFEQSKLRKYVLQDLADALRHVGNTGWPCRQALSIAVPWRGAGKRADWRDPTEQKEGRQRIRAFVGPGTAIRQRYSIRFAARSQGTDGKSSGKTGEMPTFGK